MRVASRPFLLWISTTSTAAAFVVRSSSPPIFYRTTLSLSSLSLSSSSSPSFIVNNTRRRGFATTATYANTSFQRVSSLSSQIRMSSSTTSSSSSPSGNESPSSVRVALCQFHVTYDKTRNEATAKEYLIRAKDGGATLAVLPEIWNSPYATAAFPDYADILPNIGDTNAPESSSSSQLLMDTARDLHMWIVGGSIPERVVQTSSSTATSSSSGRPEQIYNTCLVLNPDGVVVAKHRKVHLFDINVPGGIRFFESETLSPGSTVSHFTTPFGEIGVGICYDIRFAEYAMLLRQKYNCTILIYPGAFNMTTGPAHWELLQRARAIDNQCYVLTASPARSDDESSPPNNNDDDGNTSSSSSKLYPHYTAWGHSTVVSPWGDIVATIDEKEGIVFADLDLTRLEQVRKAIPIGEQKRSDLYALIEE